MNINGTPYRTIWLGNNGWSVAFIDQTRLPHELAVLEIGTLDEAAHAIKSMQVRGAPLIGAMAAYGVCLALREDASDEALDRAIDLAGGAAADGGQPALGAGGDAAAPCAICRASSASPPPTRARPRSATRTSPPTARIGEHGVALIDRAANARSRPDRQRADALQRRLARLRRPRHGAGTDLRGARPRRAGACMGRRDAAAQPGRGTDRLRARRARRAAHHHRRQRRRAPDAARAGRPVPSSAPTASPPTATSPTRSAPT